jgi:hypothetical protein
VSRLDAVQANLAVRAMAEHRPHVRSWLPILGSQPCAAAVRVNQPSRRQVPRLGGLVVCGRCG